MGTPFDPDGASDRDPEVLPRTPTLAGSTSSLDDSLLQSPHSTRFLSAPPPCPVKRSSFPGSRTPLEGNCKAWWGERISTDSSNWRASLDLRPLESLSGNPLSRETAGPLKSASQLDQVASITPVPTPNCGHSVSGAKGGPPPDAEELNTQKDAEPESSCYSCFEQGAIASAGLSESSISSLPFLGTSSIGQPQIRERNASEMNEHRLSPNLRLPSLSVDSEILYAPSIALSPHLNISRANTSMLAHCDQSTLAPPCISMTQTQCGRSALREAGIAHGSPRALAPSFPIENLPNRSHNGGFFQRLMRKTFSLSSFTPSTKGSNLPPTRSTTLIGNQKSQRSRPTRHNTMPSLGRAKAPSGSQEPSTPKKSRWALIQRFVAKPGTAAKAAGASVTRRAHPPPATRGAELTRRHTVASGHSSVVSFFGDPMGRIDPFARSSGLGATVSPVGSNPSESLWSDTLRSRAHDTHILSFPPKEAWGQSQGSDMNEAEADDSSLRLPDMLPSMLNTGSGAQAYSSITMPIGPGSMSRSMGSLACDPTMKLVGRRHSAPLLSTLSQSGAMDP